MQQIFDGLNLIEERTADGWRRRHLGVTDALDSSRAYTLDCSLAASMGGDCDSPPRSFGADAVYLTDEDPTATFVLARSLNGDVIAVIDPTDGTVVESYVYGLHGELTIRSRGSSECAAEADSDCYGRFGNAFFYTGAPRSPLTGLYDRRARQYSAALRMWLSPDPMGFVDGWDRWMYVGGDPVNFVDPLGWGGLEPENLGAEGEPTIDDEFAIRGVAYLSHYSMNDGVPFIDYFHHSWVDLVPNDPRRFGVGNDDVFRIEAPGGLPTQPLTVLSTWTPWEDPSWQFPHSLERVAVGRISDDDIERVIESAPQLDWATSPSVPFWYSPLAGTFDVLQGLNCNSVSNLTLQMVGLEWPKSLNTGNFVGRRATGPFGAALQFMRPPASSTGSESVRSAEGNGSP